MTSAPQTLVACHECDLLQYARAVPAGGTEQCRRCGAILWRDSPHGVEKTLALALAAAAAYLIANAFPIVGLNLQGNETITTLAGAVHTLWATDGMRSIAVVVAFTTIVAPGIQVAGTIYLLLPLARGRTPRAAAAVLRTLSTLEPWGMISVFMLGAIVSMVKLSHLAHLELGIGLWSFAALMLLMAAATSTFNPHAVWQRLGVAR
jgi:paraquat-inducible protein A